MGEARSNDCGDELIEITKRARDALVSADGFTREESIKRARAAAERVRSDKRRRP